MKTSCGVYLDINESDYKFKYDDMTFYFSSKSYLEKFKERYSEFIKNETNKMILNYKKLVVADYVILLKLYKLIEKRGFLVYYKNTKLNDENYYLDFEIKFR